MDLSSTAPWLPRWATGLVLAWLATTAPAPARAWPATVSAGYTHSCSLSDAALVRCWGTLQVPAEVADFPMRDVQSGQDFSCALTRFGYVSCWGNNDVGQLGSATATLSGLKLLRGVEGVQQIATGARHACALTQTSVLYCWGDASQGQQGLPARTAVADATRVTALTNVWRIAAGKGATCAVQHDGRVACVGAVIGLAGAADDPLAPRQVPGISDAQAVSIFDGHACVLRARGQVACWGNNAYGELGLPASAPHTSPVEVAGLPGAAKAVTAGQGFSCALMDNGTLQCWGRNASGQLGTGWPLHPSQAPTQVVGISNALAVSAGAEHTCAALEGGYINCWGAPGGNRLGIGLCDTHSALYPGFVYDRPYYNNAACLASATGAITPYAVMGQGPNRDIELVLRWAHTAMPGVFSAAPWYWDYIANYQQQSYAGDRSVAVNVHGTPRLLFQGPESGGQVADLGPPSHWVRQAMDGLAPQSGLQLQAMPYVNVMSMGFCQLIVPFGVRGTAAGALPVGLIPTSLRLEREGTAIEVPIREGERWNLLTTDTDWITLTTRPPGQPIPPGMQEEPVYRGVAQGCITGLKGSGAADVILFYTVGGRKGLVRTRAFIGSVS